MNTIQNPRIQAVTPLLGYSLLLTFTNGEEKVFDVTPYLDKGIFRALRTPSVFPSAKIMLGCVQWSNGEDFCPDTLYLDSVQREEISALQTNTEELV